MSLRRRLIALAAAAASLSGLGMHDAVARSPPGQRPAAGAAAAGSVAVLYAGSLLNYMERDFAPAFEHASGYGFSGYGGGSSELASEIKGGVRRGDVFISAAAAADRTLEGAAGGRWVSWYTTFAATPLLLAFNPHSRFGAQLAHGKPWYQVLSEPGVLVGRTDPKLDPKGVLTAEAVSTAAKKLHDRALAKALAAFPVYPETALVGRLQSGQLDAGFFYAVEASTAHLHTVSLAPVYKYAEYTLTILRGAANPPGAIALARYLLARTHAFTLQSNGLQAVKPRLSGSAAAVPAQLRSVVGAG